MCHCFVTGTDTDVGKTYVTSLVLKHLCSRGESAVGYKPLCCGERDDARILLESSTADGLDLDSVNPVWFPHPVSPLAAGRLAPDRPFRWDDLIEGFNRLAGRSDRVLVEGVGGWQVPLTEDRTVADLARSLELPVLVVARDRVGALNHVLLTVESIRRTGLRCVGIALNHPEVPPADAMLAQNADLLREWLGLTVVEVAHGARQLSDPGWDELLPRSEKEAEPENIGPASDSSQLNQGNG